MSSQCPPDRLGPRHIREYQDQLFAKQKLSPGTVTNHLCALRFFYIQTLKKPWSIADTPYPKKTPPRHQTPCGAAPSVADQSWSSNDLLLLKSNSVLHHCWSIRPQNCS